MGLVTTLLVDADNTLWDTDAIFADAQLRLLSKVESATGRKCSVSDRLAFVREYDQALAAQHHLHLRYPPSMLVSAVTVGLFSVTARDAARDILRGRKLQHTLSPNIVDELTSDFVLALTSNPQLLPSAREGLTLARDKGFDAYILSEGKIENQRKLLNLHKLSHLVNGVLEITKNERQFERLKMRFSPAHMYVLGDQVERDIIPAIKTGCMAVLIPSRFKPTLLNRSDDITASYVAYNFIDAISWIVNREQELKVPGPKQR